MKIELKQLKEQLAKGVRKSKFQISDKRLDILSHKVNVDFVKKELWITMYLTEDFTLDFDKNITVFIGNLEILCENYECGEIWKMSTLNSEKHEFAKITVRLPFMSIKANIKERNEIS